MTQIYVIETITGANQFTQPIPSPSGKDGGYINLVFKQGTNAWNGKLRFQRSFKSPYKGGAAVWEDVENANVTTGDTYNFSPTEITVSVSNTYFEPESDIYYRVGCKAGDYTSGQVEIRISY